MKKYVCTICGYIYDEAIGIPSSGIAAGTRWEALPFDWVCPLCGAAKADFKEQAEASENTKKEIVIKENEELRELSPFELSALCSNLARGCEKQYLAEQSALFTQLADYFKSKAPNLEQASYEAIYESLEADLNGGFAKANAAAGADKDRGAMRALVWSEKVSRIAASVLSRYEKDKEGFLKNTNIYVCETCGFIYVGDEAPALCPVCKVPSWKIQRIGRR